MISAVAVEIYDVEFIRSASLSAQQERIAELVVTGHSYARIADRLKISRVTVDHHIRELKRKLGFHPKRSGVHFAVMLYLYLDSKDRVALKDGSA